jgi:hypothetical protein
MTDFPSEDRDYYALDDLAALDLDTPADVRRRFPQAVERRHPEGYWYWLRDEIEDWSDGGEAP